MTTIQELELSAEVELEQAIKKRDRALAEQRTILATARAEGRPRLTEDEDRDIETARKRYAQAKADVKGVEGKLAQIRQAKDDEADIEADLQTRDGSKAVKLPAYDRVARVGTEERTYHKGNDRNGGAFLRDITASFLYRNPESEARLARHMGEERVERGQYLQQRAVGTGAFAGLTVPQYLTDMYAPAVAAQRPFADACNHHDLPESGMTVNISRITTATSAAVQASENTAVSETNADDTLLTEAVLTVAGQQTLSRQSIDRSTGVEDIMFDDLFRRYGSELDRKLINDTTTGLAALGVNTDFTATGAGQSQKIYSGSIGGAALVETNLLGFARPDVIIMHPRRWYKLLSAVGPNWPMIFPASGVNASNNELALGQASTNKYGAGFRGVMANGLNVVVDANVTTLGLGQATSGGSAGTTGQDHIYITSSQECHLWEDPAAPVFIRAEQTQAAALGVLMVLYGYFAYTFRRFSNAAGTTSNSVALLSGTGLNGTNLLYDGN